MGKVAESMNTKELKKITGMVRVGDLSKGLLLASDRVVDLVLLTKRPPNTLLLTEVETTLREKLNEAAAAAAAKKKALQEAAKPKEGEVEAKEEVKEPEVKVEAPEVAASESGVVVTRGFYSVRVTLASTATPDEEEQKSNQLLAKGAADRALSELRHSKWFAVTAANLPSCVECIRIVKDLCMRDPAWSVLTGWAVELLVERALYTAWMPLNPAASLMRVMEVMSSGLLLDDGPGLKDPCEKEDVNVVSGLTSQEREDITRSAQANLRRMHFRKLFKVLGMEEASEHEGEDGKED